tara:strand:+ start:107 stop:439 length:333 start_codon:yes stop_codon:yes gene_type:complete
MRAIKKGDPKKKKSIGILKSDMNRPKDKPFVGPKPLDKKRVEKLKSEIARLEGAFKREEASLLRRGANRKNYSTYNNEMRRISKEATKLNNELVKLTGKGSNTFERIKNK